MLRPLESGGPCRTSVKSRSSGMVTPSIQKQVGRLTSPLGEGSDLIIPALAPMSLTTCATKGATGGGGELAGVMMWGWLVMQGSSFGDGAPSLQKLAQRVGAWQTWFW